LFLKKRPPAPMRAFPVPIALALCALAVAVALDDATAAADDAGEAHEKTAKIEALQRQVEKLQAKATSEKLQAKAQTEPVKALGESSSSLWEGAYSDLKSVKSPVKWPGEAAFVKKWCPTFETKQNAGAKKVASASERKKRCVDKIRTAKKLCQDMTVASTVHWSLTGGHHPEWNLACTSCASGKAFVMTAHKLHGSNRPGERAGRCRNYQYNPEIECTKLDSTPYTSGIDETNIVCTKYGQTSMMFRSGALATPGAKEHFEKHLPGGYNGMKRAHCTHRKETVCHNRKCQVRKTIKCLKVCAQLWGSPVTYESKAQVKKRRRRYQERGATYTATIPLEGDCKTSLCKGKYGHIPCMSVAMMA